MLCVDFVVSSIKNQNQEFTFYYDTVDPTILAHHGTVGQPKFFWDIRLNLHGEVWAKTCLETNFRPIPKSFDHVTEVPKVPR